jgi:hypothetical protein
MNQTSSRFGIIAKKKNQVKLPNLKKQDKHTTSRTDERPGFQFELPSKHH